MSALIEDDEDVGAEIAIGATSSPAAIARLPVAEEHRKIVIVEPAFAEQIPSDKWNRHIFRTSRNSSRDAISNAVAIGVLGVDHSFGHDGVAAFKAAMAKTGATLAAIVVYSLRRQGRLVRACVRVAALIRRDWRISGRVEVGRWPRTAAVAQF